MYVILEIKGIQCCLAFVKETIKIPKNHNVMKSFPRKVINC